MNADEPMSICRTDEPVLDDATALDMLSDQQALFDAKLRGSSMDARRWGILKPHLATSAAAVGILVSEGKLRRAGTIFPRRSRYLEAKLISYGAARSLRSNDIWYTEAAWYNSYGTCCLVGPRRILTAAHVIDGSVRRAVEDGRIYAIFDFENASDGRPASVFERSNSIFRVTPPFGESGDASPAGDWITLGLDRRPRGRRRLVANSKALHASRPVYTLGHPRGLAMRFARCDNTQASSQDSRCFHAYVEAFSGSSGSPVLDSESGKLVGIVTTTYVGGDDSRFKTTAGDYVTPVCTPRWASQGALVVDASNFHEHLD